MLFFILFLSILNFSNPTQATEIEKKSSSDIKKKLPQSPASLLKEIKTQPVNNTPVAPSFPVHEENESTWAKKLQEYIYSYQIRYGSIGDRFILPQDIDAFLETLPHGTHDSPKVSSDKQNQIAISFDENYQQNVVDQYFRMQYRVLAQTLK